MAPSMPVASRLLPVDGVAVRSLDRETVTKPPIFTLRILTRPTSWEVRDLQARPPLESAVEDWRVRHRSVRERCAKGVAEREPDGKCTDDLDADSPRTSVRRCIGGSAKRVGSTRAISGRATTTATMVGSPRCVCELPSAEVPVLRTDEVREVRRGQRRRGERGQQDRPERERPLVRRPGTGELHGQRGEQHHTGVEVEQRGDERAQDPEYERQVMTAIDERGERAEQTERAESSANGTAASKNKSGLRNCVDASNSVAIGGADYDRNDAGDNGRAPPWLRGGR